MVFHDAIIKMTEFIQHFNNQIVGSVSIIDTDKSVETISLVFTYGRHEYHITTRYKNEDIEIEMWEDGFMDFTTETLYQFLFIEANERIQKGWT